jgi:hypothetical protein
MIKYIKEIPSWIKIREIQYSVVLVLVILFVFKYFALNRTIEIKQGITTYKKELQGVSGLPDRVGRLEDQLLNLEGEIGNSVDELTDLKHLLMKFIERNSADVTVRSVKTLNVKQEGDISFHTIELTVQGSFQSLCKCLDGMETGIQVGNIKSLHFQTRKLLREKRKELDMIIIFQGVQSELNDNKNGR